MAANVSTTIKAGPQRGFAPALKFWITELSVTDTYGAGGITLTASDYSMSTIYGVIPLSHAVGDTTVAILPAYNTVTGKLQFFKGAASTTVTTGSGAYAEVASNDTYLTASTPVFRLLVIGV